MSNDSIDWYFITEQIYHKKIAPVISNQVINKSLFGGDNVVRAWAERINYPLADGDNLTRVAQFLSVTRQDATRAKSGYLHFLKQSLLDVAQKAPDASQGFLDQVKSELRGLTFSQLAIERLNQPDFKQETDNPLSLLAALDLPVYLTTSHHHFMEAALKANDEDKTPRSLRSVASRSWPLSITRFAPRAPVTVSRRFPRPPVNGPVNWPSRSRSAKLSPA